MIDVKVFFQNSNNTAWIELDREPEKNMRVTVKQEEYRILDWEYCGNYQILVD